MNFVGFLLPTFCVLILSPLVSVFVGQPVPKSNRWLRVGAVFGTPHQTLSFCLTPQKERLCYTSVSNISHENAEEGCFIQPKKLDCTSLC